MKKLLILMLVLGLASAANATLLLSVDGDVDPEDTSINLRESDTVIIDIHGFDNPAQLGYMGWILIQGPGAIDASAPTYLWETSNVGNMSEPELSEYIALLPDYGYPGVVDIIEWNVQDTIEPPGEPANGLLIDGLIFHCEGEPDDVILTMMDLELFVFDTQVIHQPEPMTVMLLGLGGLFLRRRK